MRQLKPTVFLLSSPVKFVHFLQIRIIFNHVERLVKEGINISNEDHVETIKALLQDAEKKDEVWRIVFFFHISFNF